MTVLDIRADTAPEALEAAPACRHCTAEIRLSEIAGQWPWVHVDTGARRCDGAAETCHHCGLPVRLAAGIYWIHSDTGAFPCPEQYRPLGKLMYAAPGFTAGIEVAAPAEWGR